MAGLGYIELIKRFWQAAKAVTSLGQCEAWVYFNLLEKANLQRWPAKMEMPTRRTAAELGMSAKKLIEVRDTLAKIGLIGYAEGDRRKSAPQYWFPGLKPGASMSSTAPAETTPNLFTEQTKDGEREQGFCFPTENKSDDKRTDFCVREESKTDTDCFPTENKTIGFCLPQENKTDGDCFPTESKNSDDCFPTESKKDKFCFPTESKKSENEKYCFSTENKTESKTPYSYTKVYKTKDINTTTTETDGKKLLLDSREIDELCKNFSAEAFFAGAENSLAAQREKKWVTDLHLPKYRAWWMNLAQSNRISEVGWTFEEMHQRLMEALAERIASQHWHRGPGDLRHHLESRLPILVRYAYNEIQKNKKPNVEPQKSNFDEQREKLLREHPELQ